VDVKELLCLPLSVLRERVLEANAPVTEGLLLALRHDERQGARSLALTLTARARRERAETLRLDRLLTHERELWGRGFCHLAGVDEAGVAPLAGPVVAAAVILPHDFKPRGIDDSKKLSPEEREELEVAIKHHALAYSVGLGEVEDIDRINIYHASLLAMRRAVLGLALRPDHLLVDARTVPEVDFPQRGIIRGDAISLSIAAASILAKTHRDRLMRAYAGEYPGYGFERHKGYPTPDHVAALARIGVCPIHRRSFTPVREAMERSPRQQELLLRTEAARRGR
jgi:ribonuclease HII